MSIFLLFAVDGAHRSPRQVGLHASLWRVFANRLVYGACSIT
jgi:hypothetical protein